MFQQSTELKKRVERVLRKGKIVVHSRDQANMNLVRAQSYSSSLDLYHYVIELIQKHCVMLHAVQMLWSNGIKSPNKSFHNE